MKTDFGCIQLWVPGGVDADVYQRNANYALVSLSMFHHSMDYYYIFKVNDKIVHCMTVCVMMRSATKDKHATLLKTRKPKDIISAINSYNTQITNNNIIYSVLGRKPFIGWVSLDRVHCTVYVRYLNSSIVVLHHHSYVRLQPLACRKLEPHSMRFAQISGKVGRAELVDVQKGIFFVTEIGSENESDAVAEY